MRYFIGSQIGVWDDTGGKGGISTPPDRHALIASGLAMTNDVVRGYE